jgi:hypothetical protein
MRNNKNILKGSIILIVISFVISLLVTYKIKLDKPVFLKNYKEVEIRENNNIYSMGASSIELKYISNREDKRVVNSIVFKETPELNFYASEQPYNGGMIFFSDNKTTEDYGRYSVHTIYLNFNPSEAEYDLSKNIILEKATIIFSDGLTMDVDLGKIILYKGEFIEAPLKFTGTNISSEGSSQSIFLVDDYIEVSNVYSSLFIDTKDLFDFNIDKSGYMDPLNTIYNKNEYLYFTSQFHSIEDIERKLYSYDIKPTIYFKDRSGKEYKERVYNISYNPNFNFNDIYKYLRSKGEI